jgi:O-antigen/teichoic acid export membrane protein
MRETTIIGSGAIRRPAPFELVERICRQLVGRVVTLGAATALNIALALALLPLATRHLEASDYGLYGLLMSLVALVSTAADGGSSLLVPAHYGPSSVAERARLFASLAMFAGISATFGGFLLFVLWFWLHGIFLDQTVPVAAIILSAVLIPTRAITNICTTIFSAAGRGPTIAAQMAVQSLVVFLSTLVSLLVCRMGGISLFVGALCGQLAALCVGCIALGRQHILSFPSRNWLLRAATCAPTTGASGLTDGMRCFGENALLASATGIHALGLWMHARLYHGVLIAFSSAFSHSLWSKSLEEAREPYSKFETTRIAWTLVQITIACLGIIAVFLGAEIVKIVSNGKFTAAAAYVPIFFVIALIQTTEQTANAIVCATGRATSATWARTTMTLGSMTVLCPTILLFGINGALAIIIVEVVAYRAYLRVLVRRTRKVPFRDDVAYFGVFAITIEIACLHWLAPPLAVQLTLMVANILMLIVIAVRSIGQVTPAVHQIVFGPADSDQSLTSRLLQQVPRVWKGQLGNARYRFGPKMAFSSRSS